MTRKRMLFLRSVLKLEAQIALEQRHQRVDFGARPLPVLDRERVERQHADAQPRRRFDDVAHRIDAGTMALDARQVALRRPAPVAVHDDRDVGGKLIEIDLPGQRFVGRSWRDGRPGAARATSRHYKSPYSTDTRNRPSAGAVGPATSDQPPMRTSRIVFGRPSAAPDIDQRADDRPHHVAEKPFASHFVDNERSGARDDGRSNRALGRVGGASGGLKRRKIVPAFEKTGRSPHRLNVQRPGQVPRVPTLERIEYRRVPDAVTVGLGARVEAGVKLWPRLPLPTARARLGEGARSARGRPRRGTPARSSEHDAT